MVRAPNLFQPKNFVPCTDVNRLLILLQSNRSAERLGKLWNPKCRNNSETGVTRWRLLLSFILQSSGYSVSQTPIHSNECGSMSLAKWLETRPKEWRRRNAGLNWEEREEKVIIWFGSRRRLSWILRSGFTWDTIRSCSVVCPVHWKIKRLTSSLGIQREKKCSLQRIP